MGAHGVERIVALSAEPAEHWAHRGLLKQLVVFPLLQTFFGASYDDMRRMDIVLWESHVRWTTIRAPRIRDVHAKGHYRISADGPLKAGWAVTATDLASALLDLIEKDRFIRSPTFIAN